MDEDCQGSTPPADEMQLPPIDVDRRHEAKARWVPATKEFYFLTDLTTMRKVGPVFRGLFILTLLASTTLGMAPVLADHDGSDPDPSTYPAPAVNGIYPMVFPLAGNNSYTDTWHAPRSGGQVHEGTDMLADKMVRVLAVADGHVGWISDTCCALRINHTDGWASMYIHLNNDTPGTDDGLGWGIADGIEEGTFVEAGEVIGWVGDSGNAEWANSHLHFELHAPGIGPIGSFTHLNAAATGGLNPCSGGSICEGVALVTSSSEFHHLPSLIGPATEFFYGNPGDIAITGDWNCNGERTPAMYRPSTGFVYLRNSNTQGVADQEFYFGLRGDIPFAGDFNGNGCDTIGVFRPQQGKIYIKNSLGTGFADIEYYFGAPGDVPFAGDFNGNGRATICMYRPSTGRVYVSGGHSTTPAAYSFFYGVNGDKIIAGDWDGDGDDTLAVYRRSDGMLYINLDFGAGPADVTVSVGTTFQMAVAAAGS